MRSTTPHLQCNHSPHLGDPSLSYLGNDLSPSPWGPLTSLALGYRTLPITLGRRSDGELELIHQLEACGSTCCMPIHGYCSSPLFFENALKAHLRIPYWTGYHGLTFPMNLLVGQAARSPPQRLGPMLHIAKKANGAVGEGRNDAGTPL